MSVRKLYPDLNSVQVAGILFLMTERGMSQKEIGVAIGYDGDDPGNMVSQVLNSGKTFGGDRAWMFSRLCDNMGFPDVASFYCGDSRSSHPDHNGEWDLNIDPELVQIIKNSGRCKAAFERKGLSDLFEAWSHSDGLLTAVLSLRMDVRKAIELSTSGTGGIPTIADALPGKTERRRRIGAVIPTLVTHCAPASHQ